MFKLQGKHMRSPYKSSSVNQCRLYRVGKAMSRDIKAWVGVCLNNKLGEEKQTRNCMCKLWRIWCLGSSYTLVLLASKLWKMHGTVRCVMRDEAEQLVTGELPKYKWQLNPWEFHTAIRTLCKLIGFPSLKHLPAVVMISISTLDVFPGYLEVHK